MKVSKNQNMFEMMPMSGGMSNHANQGRGYQSPSMRDEVNRPRGFMPFQGSGMQIG